MGSNPSRGTNLVKEMRIEEIITNPPRDEYIDGYVENFTDASTVSTIRGLELKKIVNNDEIEYGLFNDADLVGYMSLEEQPNNIWQVSFIQLAQAYKGMGYGTFLYDYAIMNDKLTLMSDSTNTSGKHGSREMWLRLRDNNRYSVVGYDTRTHRIIPHAQVEDIFNNEPYTRWLAMASQKNINEAIQDIQQHMKKRSVVWYGPGTTTPDYFNY